VIGSGSIQRSWFCSVRVDHEQQRDAGGAMREQCGDAIADDQGRAERHLERLTEPVGRR
jgi:hypothetical protein